MLITDHTPPYERKANNGEILKKKIKIVSWSIFNDTVDYTTRKTRQIENNQFRW